MRGRTEKRGMGEDRIIGTESRNGIKTQINLDRWTLYLLKYNSMICATYFGFNESHHQTVRPCINK
jgi:hypothetical protein